MRVVIFGASSRAGLYVVKEALERGHLVAAFTSRRGDFPLGHPKLDIIGGDVQDAEAVARAVLGARGVISALGARCGKAAAARHSRAMENIVRGMREAGCRRGVWLSRASATRTPFPGEDELASLRASGLDWTLVAAPGLREGAGPKPVRVRLGELPGRYVALADLAIFLIEELETGRYAGKLVSVSSP
jgi:putative NADH-flavin reductase